MDWNSHKANTAYLNKVVDARALALAEKGFPMEEFIRLHLGVVIMRDELEDRREVKWMERDRHHLLACWVRPRRQSIQSAERGPSRQWGYEDPRLSRLMG